MNTLITTSYNQLPTLKLLLASLRRQTCMDFEVLVADDGSSDGTAEFCAGWAAAEPFRLRFVTQPDQGYRKAKILNEALRQCAGSEYLIFLDSDVVVERHFVEDHLRLRREGAYVCGRRVDLGAASSARVTESGIASGWADWPVWAALRDPETLGWKRGIRVVAPWLRGILGYDRPLDILGSNLGVWRRDLISVNGFNEALQSYWGEDGDLYIRLRNSGLRAIGAKNICVQVHLFHPRRTPDPANVAAYERMLSDWEYRWCVKGLQAQNESAR